MNNSSPGEASSLFRAIRLIGFQFRWIVMAVAILLGAGRAHATTVIAPDFAGLVNGADYVVRATVTSVTAEFRKTPSGQAIFTKVELKVVETITGTPPSPLVLELLGGTVQGVTMHVDGMPQFKVGDENILFVQGNGLQVCPLVGMMNGVYSVKTDPTGVAYVARGNGVPLYDEQDVKQEMTSASAAQTAHPGQAPLTPSVFADKIRAAAQNQANASAPSPLAN